MRCTIESISKGQEAELKNLKPSRSESKNPRESAPILMLDAIVPELDGPFITRLGANPLDFVIGRSHLILVAASRVFVNITVFDALCISSGSPRTRRLMLGSEINKVQDYLAFDCLHHCRNDTSEGHDTQKLANPAEVRETLPPLYTSQINIEFNARCPALQTINTYPT